MDSLPSAQHGEPGVATRSFGGGECSQAHHDPFDRIIAAQAEPERLVLLTGDPQLSTFPCGRICTFAAAVADRISSGARGPASIA
jgi:hypothetical protein